MVDIAALEKRKDELQGLYNQTNSKARELAGAIAMLEEIIEMARKEELPAAPVEESP